jgi:MYND finger.
MGKQKKDSKRQQSIPCAQDVVMRHETSPAKVCSGKASEKTNTETNIFCGISPTLLLSSTETTLPNLTSTPQIMNDSIHTDATELHDLLHTDKKHLSTPSTKDKCLIKQKDKKHNNSDHVSGMEEANIELIQDTSPSSHTSETEITEMSGISAQTAPNVTELSHIIVQQNVTFSSTKNATERHLDPYGTSKSRMSHETIKSREIISQSTECIKPTTPKSKKCKESIINFNFLQSQDLTMPSQSTVSRENTMKTRNEIGHRKSSVFDLGKQPEVLPVSTPLLNDTQNAEQTAGPPNQQDNDKQHVARNVATKTEQSVNSLTMQGGTSTEDDDVRTSTTESTQNLLSNATNHGAQVSEFGKKAAGLSLTTNTEVQKVLAASSMLGNEAMSVLGDNNTTEKMLVCVKTGTKEMPSKTTEVRTAKRHTSLDTSVLNVSLPAVSKPLESTVLPNMEEPPRSPDVLIKQTEIKKKRSSSTKWHGPADKTHVVEKVVEKTRRKCGDSSHKTQGTHEIDNTALEILKEIPVKTSKPLRYNTPTFCMEDSADTDDVQISDKRPASEKDEFMKEVTSVDKNLRNKRTAKANHKPVDSKDKQENNGIYKSHISIYNQFSNNKEQCKVTTHENKTDTNNSQTKGNGVINHTDKKSRIINTDGETNTMFNSKESYNKVCKKKITSETTNNDRKIDMNTETSEKSKLNFHTQNTMPDFISNPMDQNISISCHKNVKRHKRKNTQNSITYSVVDESKKEAINDQTQHKKKNRRRNRGKNTVTEGNERNFRQEEYEANETCGCKEEKLEFQMDPETMKVKGKQNEDLKSEYSSELITEEPSETKSGATLSKEHLKYLTRTGLQLSVSCNNSGRLPDNMFQVLAPKPTNTLSTVDDEAEMEHKLIQRNIFLTYVCHVCKSLVSSSSSLKKCSNCKMISYCSKEHQKEHWPAHKDLCKVISKICKQNCMTNLFGKAVGISPDEYRYYRSHCINKCEKELGRELYLWEKEMICYPQVCHTCYEFDTQKLTTCQKCHHVSYCKLSHLKTDHDVWCKEFQIYRDITLYQYHHGIIQPLLPDRSLQQYAPLTGDMKTFLLNINTVQEKSTELHRLKLVALSDIATCPLTVLFSLQQCNFHLETTETLTIHLVGAEMQFEAETLQKWELFLLHLIPSLNMLKVVFIGPELKTESEFIQTLGKNKTCMKCNTAGRMVIYEFWETLYHKFFMSSDYQKPDLICAFNAGLYRLTDFEGKDTWSPTIKVMLEEPDIPVVVTEYTQKELPFDLQRTQDIVDSLEIITPPTRNPFASLKPSLNFLSEETVPVIFKNFYITIFHGEKL